VLQKRFATLIFLGIFLKAMPARLTRAMISWKLRACRSRCTSWMMAAAVGDPRSKTASFFLDLGRLLASITDSAAESPPWGRIRRRRRC